MKHNLKGSRPPRKRNKTGASYGTIDVGALLRPSERKEEIRVWDMTISERTGRVSATRKNHKHIYKSPMEPPLEESPLEEPLLEEPPILEGVGAPADSKSIKSRAARSAAKRKRVRIRKENDSVSSVLVPSTNLLITRWQTKMTDWLVYRPVVLDEFLRRDGLGDSATPGICVNCSELAGKHKCRDCSGGKMYCSGCILSVHRDLPLHRVEVRPGEFLILLTAPLTL